MSSHLCVQAHTHNKQLQIKQMCPHINHITQTPSLRAHMHRLLHNLPSSSLACLIHVKLEQDIPLLVAPSIYKNISRATSSPCLSPLNQSSRSTDSPINAPHNVSVYSRYVVGKCVYMLKTKCIYYRHIFFKE